MYEIAQDHETISHPHAIRILNNFQGYTRGSLKKLEDEGWIRIENQNWSLTPKGYNKVQQMYYQKDQDE